MLDPNQMLDAYQVRQQVPGFPYRHYSEDDEGEMVLYARGTVDLARTRIQPVFSLPDSANDIYQLPAASAEQWERAEPRGILTPWREIEQQVADGAANPIVVRAQPDGTFLILDGHHRISMARHLGIDALDSFIDWAGIDPAEHELVGTRPVLSDDSLASPEPDEGTAPSLGL
jgi:hypothetical protein